MSLFEELIEDRKEDEKIIKSFKSKNTLSPEIFKKDNETFVLQDDIRKKLIEIADEYIEFIGIDFFIHDIVLTGSLANYNWSSYSDVDLHIVIDLEEMDEGEKKQNLLKDILKELLDAKEKAWKYKHSIKIKNYDLEIYVQDINEPHVSSGVYSILKNKWIIEPEKTNPKIDDNKILQKGEHYAKKIDELVNKFNNDEDVKSEVSSLYKKIKNFRQSGLQSGGEYSYENLTFKLLRRNGYIEKILNLKNNITDKKLSISH
jgi:hypothetical protein